MRKFIPVLAIAVLVLTSCRTVVPIGYMQPSAIDMGGYRNLAVASAVPYGGPVPGYRFVGYADVHAAGLRIYSGYASSTAQRIADYATTELYSTLSASGFYNLLPPDMTDAVLEAGRYGTDISEEFSRMGYDAVLIPRISSMSLDESIYSIPRSRWWTDDDGIRHRCMVYDYGYIQTASIVYTLTVIDTSTGRIAAVRTFSDSETRRDQLDPYWHRLDDPAYLFRRMISSFNGGILRLFVPLHREYDAALMANKPENAASEAAYEAVRDGNTDSALAIFLSQWEESGHVPSGYNAAVLIAAEGRFDEALDLLSSVMEADESGDARDLYRALMAVRASDEQAGMQISGESSAAAGAVPDGNAVYDMVMRR